MDPIINVFNHRIARHAVSLALFTLPYVHIPDTINRRLPVVHIILDMIVHCGRVDCIITEIT